MLAITVLLAAVFLSLPCALQAAQQGATARRGAHATAAIADEQKQFIVRDLFDAWRLQVLATIAQIHSTDSSSSHSPALRVHTAARSGERGGAHARQAATATALPDAVLAAVAARDRNRTTQWMHTFLHNFHGHSIKHTANDAKESALSGRTLNALRVNCVHSGASSSSSSSASSSSLPLVSQASLVARCFTPWRHSITREAQLMLANIAEDSSNEMNMQALLRRVRGQRALTIVVPCGNRRHHHHHHHHAEAHAPLSADDEVIADYDVHDWSAQVHFFIRHARRLTMSTPSHIAIVSSTLAAGSSERCARRAADLYDALRASVDLFLGALESPISVHVDLRPMQLLRAASEACNLLVGADDSGLGWLAAHTSNAVNSSTAAVCESAGLASDELIASAYANARLGTNAGPPCVCASAGGECLAAAAAASEKQQCGTATHYPLIRIVATVERLSSVHSAHEWTKASVWRDFGATAAPLHAPLLARNDRVPLPRVCTFVRANTPLSAFDALIALNTSALILFVLHSANEETNERFYTHTLPLLRRRRALAHSPRTQVVLAYDARHCATVRKLELLVDETRSRLTADELDLYMPLASAAALSANGDNFESNSFSSSARDSFEWSLCTAEWLDQASSIPYGDYPESKVLEETYFVAHWLLQSSENVRLLNNFFLFVHASALESNAPTSNNLWTWQVRATSAWEQRLSALSTHASALFAYPWSTPLHTALFVGGSADAAHSFAATFARTLDILAASNYAYWHADIVFSHALLDYKRRNRHANRLQILREISFASNETSSQLDMTKQRFVVALNSTIRQFLVESKAERKNAHIKYSIGTGTVDSGADADDDDDDTDDDNHDDDQCDTIVRNAAQSGLPLETIRTKFTNETVVLCIGLLSRRRNVAYRAAIRRAWLSEATAEARHFFNTRANVYVLIRFFVGEEEAPLAVALEDQRDETIDTIQLPMRESYQTIGRKSYCMLKWANAVSDTWQKTFSLKADDDVYIDLHAISNELRETINALGAKRSSSLYAGQFKRFTRDRTHGSGSAALRARLRANAGASILRTHDDPFSNEARVHLTMAASAYLLGPNIVHSLGSANSMKPRFYVNEDEGVARWLDHFNVERHMLHTWHVHVNASRDAFAALAHCCEPRASLIHTMTQSHNIALCYEARRRFIANSGGKQFFVDKTAFDGASMCTQWISNEISVARRAHAARIRATHGERCEARTSRHSLHAAARNPILHSLALATSANDATVDECGGEALFIEARNMECASASSTHSRGSAIDNDGALHYDGVPIPRGCASSTHSRQRYTWLSIDLIHALQEREVQLRNRTNTSTHKGSDTHTDDAMSALETRQTSLLIDAKTDNGLVGVELWIRPRFSSVIVGGLWWLLARTILAQDGMPHGGLIFVGDAADVARLRTRLRSCPVERAPHLSLPLPSLREIKSHVPDNWLFKCAFDAACALLDVKELRLFVRLSWHQSAALTQRADVAATDAAEAVCSDDDALIEVTAQVDDGSW